MRPLFQSNIPGDVSAMEYAKNHHYLRLRDSDGNETTMVEYGLVKYICAKCLYVFFSETNQANNCCRCGCREIASQWTKPQVSLVPEHESGFQFVGEKKSEV